jgi:hypothetical protein
MFLTWLNLETRATVKNLAQLDSQLGMGISGDHQRREDPIMRFMYATGHTKFSTTRALTPSSFFSAPTSRSRLKTTRKMFAAVLTCHQVMPQFLDFVYPFGEQVRPEDFHFSAFRENHRFNKTDCTAQIPELSRSGRQYEMCFNLRSVETATGTPEWPFTIRQTAVYHSFDIISRRTVWIIVKGNHLMRDRIRENMRTSDSTEEKDIHRFDLLAESFCASLGIHLILCDWARGEWRWYIKFLENQFQEITGTALHETIDHPSTPTSPLVSPLLRSETAPNPSQRRGRAFSWSSISQGVQTRRAMTVGLGSSSIARPENEEHEIVIVVREKQAGDDPQFSFNKLQVIQNLQEKANETSLVLTMNINVIEKLREYYENLISLRCWPEKFEEQTHDAVQRFQRAVSEAISDMEMQRSRLENLRHVLADRKALVSDYVPAIDNPDSEANCTSSMPYWTTKTW